MDILQPHAILFQVLMLPEAGMGPLYNVFKHSHTCSIQLTEDELASPTGVNKDQPQSPIPLL